ncbi:MAG: hypothetical protein F9K23_00885 [Bacteroidetes bacterium]|nr:MAG: hypothetical protein F9K23_00885 [Bacteroidota bacterium]
MNYQNIKTFEDALAATGETFNLPDGLSADTIAYEKLKIVAKALNEGWTPDWTNSKERKYTVVLYNYQPGGVGFVDSGCDYWNSVTYCGSRLCYPSAEIAMYAGKQFRDLYNQFFN